MTKEKLIFHLTDHVRDLRDLNEWIRGERKSVQNVLENLNAMMEHISKRTRNTLEEIEDLKKGTKRHDQTRPNTPSKGKT